MIVIFDTNIWISDLALTSSVGSAVRFYLREQKGRIALPEVIKLETEFRLRSTLAEHINSIRASHRQLLAVFGRLKEVVLPSEQDVEALISRVFSGLGVEIQEYPFSLESARASLIRAVQHLPPSDKNQQFKDGVLWEDCLVILKTEPVYLVTADKAFYKNRDPSLGLADELSRDVSAAPNEFRIFPSLRDLLRQIGTGVNIDPASLMDAYMAIQGDELRDMANRHSFSIEGDSKATLDVFATEKPSHLYLTFTIEVPCVDATTDGRTGARILANGEGTYDAEADQFVELANRGEQLLYQLHDGTEKSLERIVLTGLSAVMGHRTVEYSVRHRLEK
jgi:hypothetical protein